MIVAATVTLIGNTTSDIELRFTQSGKAVGSVTIAVSDRVKDANGDWVDGKTWFARCTLWGELADHAAASIVKGTRVIAHGRVEQREWEDKDGNKRTSVEVTVDEIGPSVRYATAQVTRTTPGASQAGRGATNTPGWDSDIGSQVTTPQDAVQGNKDSGWGDENVPF